MKNLFVFYLIFVLVGSTTFSSRVEAMGTIVRFIGNTLLRTAFRGAARGIVRGSFRRLSAGAGRRLIANGIRSAMQTARSRRVLQGQKQMNRLFGKRPYHIRGKNGRIVSTAQMEGDLLVFRSELNKIGFAQWEHEGLVLYRYNGQRLARLVEAKKNSRLLAYDNEDNYLGQFIRDNVEDHIVDMFVDSLGKQSRNFILPEPKPGTQILESERLYSFDENGNTSGYSTIKNGILYVYNYDGVELARGIMEENSIILYDSMGEIQGEFRKEKEKIIAYDKYKIASGYIIVRENKAIYFDYENPKKEQLWVTF